MAACADLVALDSHSLPRQAQRCRLADKALLASRGGTVEIPFQATPSKAAIVEIAEGFENCLMYVRLLCLEGASRVRRRFAFDSRIRHPIPNDGFPLLFCQRDRHFSFLTCAAFKHLAFHLD